MSQNALVWCGVIGFEFQGQITIGGQTFRGTAAGGSTLDGVHVAPFPLVGFVEGAPPIPLATCSGLFEGQGTGVLPILGPRGAIGAAASFLDCYGSANGGPVGHLTLVSVYPVAENDPWAGGIDYVGAFTGY